MLDPVQEFFKFSLFFDSDITIPDGDFQASCGKSAHKNNTFGILSDVDEPACAGQSGAEFTDIEIAFFISLGQSQKSDIKTAAVIKIKLGWLPDNSVGIGGRTEIKPSGRSPPMTPGSAVRVIILKCPLIHLHPFYPILTNHHL